MKMQVCIERRAKAVDERLRPESGCGNRVREPFTLQPFDRLAHLVIVPVAQAAYRVVDAFYASERAAGGFGSKERCARAD